VENGVERISRILMPALVLLSIIIAGYSITRPGAIDGVFYFLVPSLRNFSVMTIVAALGQLFYSLSIAMGILYTYGSYMKKEIDIESATTQVEIFDTAIAIIAGLMIIPAVFAFSGGSAESLGKGPSLMFITLPKIFAEMGSGRIAGILFFSLVFFAALTSSVSLAESCVSTIQDEARLPRNKSASLVLIISIVLGMLSSLGFNLLSDITPLGMDILSFFDFTTNSVMMPIAAAATCLLILKVTGIETIEQEVTSSSAFRRKKMYKAVIKYLSLVFLFIILISSVLDALGIIHI
jgi:NSS family neurotransmitter:Na+ symporter